MLSRKRVIATLAVIVMLLAGLSLVSTFEANANPGHPQKKLFNGQWYQQVGGGDYASWMNLSTSQPYLLCGSSTSDCGSRWLDPLNAAANDWNAQNTTVDLAVQPDQSDFYDVNIDVSDLVFDTLGIQGVALTFDSSYTLCLLPCSSPIRYGWVLLSDDSHVGAYGTENVRQSTVSHELGHLYALRHESVNSDESVLYNCGFDNTGPIPDSIMSYNCIDPVSVGGQGLYTVQPWDACGVNHAYYDPTIGYAGCGLASPTPSPSPTFSPTPSPTAGPTATPTAPPTASSPTPTASPSTPPPGHQETWGDGDCDGTVGTRDSQALLRRVLQQNALSQTQPCPLIGTSVTVDGNDRIWGDGDCDGTVGTRDSQALLRRVLQQNALSQTQPCPNIGQTVSIGSTPPTPGPTAPPSQTFSDGTWIVGLDIQPGLWRNDDSSDFCYWARLSGLGGELDDIISNGSSTALQTVEILPSDFAFEAIDCGTWSQNLQPPSSGPTQPFGDGMWLVPSEVAPGIWRNSDSSEFCYWERLSGFGGSLSDIIVNNVSFDIQTVEIEPGDKGFTSWDCGVWTKIG